MSYELARNRCPSESVVTSDYVTIDEGAVVCDVMLLDEYPLHD